MGPDDNLSWSQCDGDCTRKRRFRQPICNLTSGPEGIRTPGLLSAIEARSQLRYRPVSEQIVSDPLMNVKLEALNIHSPVVSMELEVKTTCYIVNLIV